MEMGWSSKQSTPPTRAIACATHRAIRPPRTTTTKSASDSAESEPHTSDRTASMTQGVDGK